ncbi:MOSC domain-containing protein [Fischerella thermalis CCMEE 5205]|nr:MOSC domain-containing protein [Fischerella thermalis CCMEE 5205]
MPYVAKILIYPIKSLDGVEVKTTKVLSSGAIQYDREFAIVDELNRFVNGKRHAKVHLLRSQYNLEDRTVLLKISETNCQQVFHLDYERQALEDWLSNFFGFAVKLQQNSVMGFPDDTVSPGPTIISTATLKEVASWFAGISVNQMRRRIRANIEIDGVPAFWEDRLFGEQGDVVPFQVGNVHLLGINPCQRCVVPTRDSLSGEVYKNFQKVFVAKRQQTLPSWVASSHFNHFYRLSVNTRLSPSSVDNNFKIGDEVEILEKVKIGNG